MKIVIISDIHDNIANLKQCFAWCDKKNIDAVICCGDVANSETLYFMNHLFKKDIYLVRGNADIYDEEEIKQYDNMHYQGRTAVFEIGGINVGVCHEPFLIDKIIDGSDIVFYGHTHKPWTEKKQNIEVFNPGTLGGMFQKSTFAYWNTEKQKLDLKITENL